MYFQGMKHLIKKRSIFIMIKIFGIISHGHKITERSPLILEVEFRCGFPIFIMIKKYSFDSHGHKIRSQGTCCGYVQKNKTNTEVLAL